MTSIQIMKHWLQTYATEPLCPEPVIIAEKNIRLIGARVYCNQKFRNHGARLAGKKLAHDQN